MGRRRQTDGAVIEIGVSVAESIPDDVDQPVGGRDRVRRVQVKILRVNERLRARHGGLSEQSPGNGGNGEECFG